MLRLASPQLAALAILALALAAGRAGQTVVDVSGLPLHQLPRQLGPWTCTDDTMLEKSNEEVVWASRTYEREDGSQVYVVLQVTSSRLGGLRNWSVAQMGNGWNVEEPSVLGPVQVEGLPFELRLSRQWMHRPGARQFAVTWFASPRTQAVSYDRAQLLGWRDKLLGGCLWGEMYVRSLSAKDGETAQEAVEEFAVLMAPQFHALLSNADQTGTDTDAASSN
ncbi:MAG: exosortase-associated EpsI family protein [Armatimonadota bacterium]